MTDTQEKHQNAESIESAANLYFSTLNPLANRIHSDISEMSQAYSNLWHDFTPRERDEVINETLIKPEYVLKYLEDVLINSPQQSVEQSMKHGGKSGSFDDEENISVSSLDASTDSSTSNIIGKYAYDEKHLITYALLLTGQRQIPDDCSGIYFDEHSAPFSFKTRSQININMFDTDKVSLESSVNKNSVPAVLALQNLKNKTKNTVIRDADATVTNKKTSKSKNKKKSTSKYSIASSINSQHSRKNFMSKLFSGLVHGSGSNDSILKQNEDEKEILYNDHNNDSLFDMISATQGLNIINDERNGNAPSSLDNREGYDDKPNSCNEFKSLLSSDDASKDYDFLNNW